MNRAQEIFAILSDVYEQSPWTLQQIEADLIQEQMDYFYVFCDQKLVGFLALQDLAGELEITNISVKKAYQGQGFASQLLRHLDKRSENIFLEVRASNQAALALYKKHAFRQVGKRKNYYHNPVEDALLLTRGDR